MMRDKVKIDLEDYIDPDQIPFVVATGSYLIYEGFRVVYVSPTELRLEVQETDNALGESVWVSTSKYYNQMRSCVLSYNGVELRKMRFDVLTHLLHELLEVYYGELNYPFEIYQKDHMGSWRIVCVGPNQFKWDDVVENSMGEKVYAKRADLKEGLVGAETENVESACLYFLKKIITKAQKRLNEPK